MGNVTSPCINICKLDENKICIGCFRNIEEITNWTSYSNEEKLTIIQQLESRMWEKYNV